MIGRLMGRVVALAQDELILEVGSVGYRLSASARVLARLSVGEAVVMHVETQMSEAALKLYGFIADEDRAWFARLQDAPGVGAKAALAILDVLDAPSLADAIALGDTAAISRAHGVGKKIAERVVAEFKGKPAPLGFYASAASAVPAVPNADGLAAAKSQPAAAAALRTEAISALTNLGYAAADAQRAVASAVRSLGAEADTAALIRAGLKELSA
jgi:Holliday junction DNA helicase RuvA